MQLKKCQLYIAHVEEAKKGKGPSLDDFPVFQEFIYVFEEIPCFPPKRDIDFFIDVVPKATPVSKIPCRMSTPKLKKLQM